MKDLGKSSTFQLQKLSSFVEFANFALASWLYIKLGEYKPLGEYSAQMPNYRNWNGHIHTFEEVMDLYQPNNWILWVIKSMY